jgi:SAM-dependent methyltransferase
MSKDLFSTNSSGYAAFRPTYPRELYEFIVSKVNKTDTAWDCACGNGQVARDLSEYFASVYATDHSAAQLANAFQKDNIIYSVASAEASGFPDRYFDIVTVGQALHWFNIPAFFQEARRVLRPGGVVAVWGYSLLKVSSEIDPLLNHFYTEIIGPYWDKERKLIDEQYETILFPFDKIATPSFEFSFEWTIDELSGYLTTWSSVQKYIKAHGVNPVHEFIEEIRPMWKGKMKVSFPLFVLVGKV